METGAGVSTVYFAACGFRHTAIAPDAQLFARIRDYCNSKGISLDKVRFVDSPSEKFLPGLEGPPLDLFLIDGRHGFPSPFIDWYYGSQAVKVGGYVAVDDTQLLTGEILQEFMKDDTHWDQGIALGKTSVFRKLDSAIHADEWAQQVFLTSGRKLTARVEESVVSDQSTVVPRAWRLCSKGDHEGALRLTQSIAAPDYEVLIVRGHALRRLGRYQEAEASIQHAKRLFPDIAAGHIESAWLALQRGDAASALRDALQAKDRSPQAAADPGLHDVLCVAYKQTGRFPEALAAVDEAIRLRPGEPWYHVHRSQCLLALQRHGEALAAAEHALMLDPRNADAVRLKEDAAKRR